MRKQKNREKSKISPIPDTFNSISEAASFWDNHDSADYEDLMREVEFDVEISRHNYLVSISGNILNALQKKAKSEGISTETLINLLLQEHAS